MVKLAMKLFLASTSMVKPQNHSFTSFMDDFHLGEKQSRNKETVLPNVFQNDSNSI